MSESKRKSRSASIVMASEARCIYCSNPPSTIEHMPPMAMFRSRLRPSGMEFAACKDCNNGTRGTDAVAALMARLHPDNGDGTWQANDIGKLIRIVDQVAPGVREEMTRRHKSIHEYARRPGSGLLQHVVRVHADGPLVHAHLSVFGAKLAMALYREHVGCPLPLSGAVWTQFALSGGMSQSNLNARVQILPLLQTLKQGSFHVGNQFAYRFNCDGRTVVAALAEFHHSLWFTVFASSDPKIIALFETPELLALPASALVRPGNLLNLLSPTTKDVA